MFLGCVLALGCLGGPAACTANGAESPNGGAPPLATGGAPPATRVELKFRDTPIQVLPREERRITVQISPPGAYTVRFALLAEGTEGARSTVDAALDRAEVLSDASGVASVMLTAPSVASDFTLRAQASTAWATTGVSVLPGALATLAVHPIYLGRRTVTEWAASAHVGVSCEDFRDGEFPESTLLVRATGDAALRLEDVPATEKLAVTLQADAIARGCATVEYPTPNADTDVNVTAVDLPILLARTRLQVSLGVAAKDAAFAAEFDTGLSQLQGALRNGAANDPSAVLDAMQASFSGSSAARFAQARSDAGWDQRLLVALGRGAEARLSDAVARYGRAGRAPLFSAQAFEGQLSGSESPNVPSFELLRIAGIAAGQLELGVGGGAWSVDSTDALSFSASLSWPATQLVAGLSEAAASAETGAPDVPSALARGLSCLNVARTLAADKEIAKPLLSDCPEECLLTTCETALSRMWERARVASIGHETSMDLIAIGAASVGPERQAVALDGAWAGRLTRATGSSQSGGVLAGDAPR